MGSRLEEVGEFATSPQPIWELISLIGARG